MASPIETYESTKAAVALLREIWGYCLIPFRIIRCMWRDRGDISHALPLVSSHIDRAKLQATQPHLVMYLSVFNASFYDVSFRYERGRFKVKGTALSGDIEMEPQPSCKRLGTTHLKLTAWISQPEADAMRASVDSHIVINISDLEIKVILENPPSGKERKWQTINEIQFDRQHLQADPHWIAHHVRELHESPFAGIKFLYGVSSADV